MTVNDKRQNQWRKSLLKLTLVSWLIMGILLGIYFKELLEHFTWLIWLCFIASASGTIILAITKEDRLAST